MYTCVFTVLYALCHVILWANLDVVWGARLGTTDPEQGAAGARVSDWRLNAAWPLPRLYLRGIEAWPSSTLLATPSPPPGHFVRMPGSPSGSPTALRVCVWPMTGQGRGGAHSHGPNGS